mmetsp:Transcript_34679/g.90789  ORF Transcript_34679/g.90789 Transcript_34679/m.90789 type:complete len:208 (+) Transcript_34679:373-996(+)
MCDANSRLEETFGASRQIVYRPSGADDTYGSVIDGEGFELCKICYETNKDVALPCGHLLCKGCCDSVMAMRQACPFCRAPARKAKPIQIAGDSLKAHAGEPWCAAGLERKEVVHRLKTMEAGSFFVRESSTRGDTYTIDVVTWTKIIKSFRITQSEGQWSFDLDVLNPDEGVYNSLHELLAAFPHPRIQLRYPGGHGGGDDAEAARP